MDELVEIALGQEAIDYIRERLGDGKTIASHILQNVDLGRGSVHTLLPDYVPPASVIDLREGVLYRDPATFQYQEGKDGRRYRIEPVPNVNESLVAAIEASSPTWLWIFEEGLANPSDPWLKKRPLGRLVDFGEELNWLADRLTSHDDITWTVAHCSGPWPGLLAFAVERRDLPTIDDQFDPATPEMIAHHLQELVLGAYYGEAFICWTPN